MSREDAADFAVRRRQGMSEAQRRKQIDDFDAAGDAFTTCQRCMKTVAARHSEAGWYIPEHDCVDK